MWNLIHEFEIPTFVLGDTLRVSLNTLLNCVAEFVRHCWIHQQRPIGPLRKHYSQLFEDNCSRVPALIFSNYHLQYPSLGSSNSLKSVREVLQRLWTKSGSRQIRNCCKGSNKGPVSSTIEVNSRRGNELQGKRRGNQWSVTGRRFLKKIVRARSGGSDTWKRILWRAQVVKRVGVENFLHCKGKMISFSAVLISWWGLINFVLLFVSVLSSEFFFNCKQWFWSFQFQKSIAVAFKVLFVLQIKILKTD